MTRAVAVTGRRCVRRRHTGVAAALCLGVSLIGVAPAAGAPGDLDASFGTDGIVTGGLLKTFGPVDVDSDGRIHVLGLTSDDRAAVVRHRPDGSADTSFSGDGRAIVEAPGVGLEIFAVRALGDGTVVAVGTGREAPDPFGYAFVAKFGATGAPIASFGTNGVARLAVEGMFDQPLAASIAPNGNVVFSNTVGGPVTGFKSVTGNGTFTPFQYDFADSALPADPASCSVQSFQPIATVFVDNDRFAHAGDIFGGCNDEEFFHTVVTVQSLSTGNAVWSTRLPSGEFMGSSYGTTPLALIDGLVVATYIDDLGSQSRLRRLALTDGAIDASFGGSGAVTPPPSFGPIGDIAALAGGHIGVVSAGGFDDTAPTSVRTLRLTPSGAIDPTFPTAVAPVGGSLRRSAIAGAPDAGVLVTASTETTGALRRYDGGAAPSALSALTPLQPGRLLDTRDPGGATVDGQFQAQGTRPADGELALQVAGRGGVPDDAAAVVLNVTVTGPQGAGFVTAWPCDEPRPDASSLNFTEGQTVPNAAVVKLSPSGTVCLYNAQAATDLLADVNGYFPAGSGFEPLQPGRILDTRSPGGSTVDGQFQAQGAPAADSETQLLVAGRSGVPDDAAAVVLNVTVVGAQGAGFVTVWPCGESRPDASSLNFTEGQTVPNAVVAKVGVGGAVCLYNAQAAVDLLADVNGYFPAGAGYESLQPKRLLDTRNPGGSTVDSQFEAQGTLAADGELALQVAGRGGVPEGASAAVLNVTVTGAQGAGFVTVWPCGEPRPDASSLNFTEGQTVPNAVVVKLSAAGTVCLYNAQAATDLLADVNGYFP